MSAIASKNLLTEQEQTYRQCPAVDGNSESCVCKSPNGIIDLRQLSNRDGTARFRNVNDNHNYYYDFNPCQVFIAEGNCISVHVCQSAHFNTSFHHNIADQGSEEMWIDSELGPFLYYTGPGNRDVKIYLHCEKSLKTGEEKLTTTGDSKKSLSYIFDLYSCHACPGGCGNQFSVHAGEIGFFLMSFFVLGVVMYLVIGAIILKFHLGMTGTDIIPNRDFWADLPHLIQDGCHFTFQKCCFYCLKKRQALIQESYL